MTHIVSTSLLIVVISLLSALCSLYPDIFQYERSAIAESGEIWRVVTGHLSHFSLEHGLFNLLALLILLIMAQPLIKMYTIAVHLFIYAILLSAAFYLLLPELTYYRGLSGILHSLFVTVALMYVAAANRVIGIAMFAIITVKLIYENIFDQTVTRLDIDVISEAHLFGALIGLMIAVPTARHLHRRLSH